MERRGPAFARLPPSPGQRWTRRRGKHGGAGRWSGSPAGAGMKRRGTGLKLEQITRDETTEGSEMEQIMEAHQRCEPTVRGVSPHHVTARRSLALPQSARPRLGRSLALPQSARPRLGRSLALPELTRLRQASAVVPPLAGLWRDKTAGHAWRRGAVERFTSAATKGERRGRFLFFDLLECGG